MPREFALIFLQRQGKMFGIPFSAWWGVAAVLFIIWYLRYNARKNKAN